MASKQQCNHEGEAGPFCRLCGGDMRPKCGRCENESVVATVYLFAKTADAPEKEAPKELVKKHVGQRCLDVIAGSFTKRVVVRAKKPPAAPAEK